MEIVERKLEKWKKSQTLKTVYAYGEGPIPWPQEASS